MSFKEYLKEKLKEKLKSNIIFFAKSKFIPKNWYYDHVGFILPNGKLIQMSGHRLKDGIFQLDKLTDDSSFLKNDYETLPLLKYVNIPNKVPSGVENCTSFVSNILKNNGIKSLTNDKLIDIFKNGKEKNMNLKEQ